MVRGDKILLSKLEPGDRFYKADDGTKKVYQLREKRSHYFSKYTCDADGKFTKHGILMKEDTDVVFLRHTKNLTTTNDK